MPVQGTNNFEDNELFDVATEVKTFLKGNKKVLLLLGDSGMGKSLFSRALERELWENYDISNIFLGEKFGIASRNTRNFECISLPTIINVR